jgi:hypothetical protein
MEQIMQTEICTCARAAVMALAVMATAIPIAAHETISAGNLRMTIGWRDEPAFSGLSNAVEVDVTDAHHSPVVDPAARLMAEVTFGSQRVVLPMQPVREHAGRFAALLMPTRSGTYGIRVTGSIRKQAVDLNSVCSDTTFSCVVDVGEIQFPAKDPSVGQLADRVSRTAPRAERALTAAANARLFGIGASTIAGIALAVTVLVGGRTRRRER